MLPHFCSLWNKRCYILLCVKYRQKYQEIQPQIHLLKKATKWNTVFRWEQVGSRFSLSNGSPVPSVGTFMPRQNVKVALSGRVVCWGALEDNVTVETVQHIQVNSEIVKSGGKKMKGTFFWGDEKNIYRTIRRINEYFYLILCDARVLKCIFLQYN